MQPITQGRASNSKHHWLYPSSTLSTSPQQHNCKPCNAINRLRMATRFVARINFQVRTICTPGEGSKCIENRGNRLWCSWKVVWSKYVSMIRAWSSPDSNMVTNNVFFGDWKAAWGIWWSQCLFPSSSSIVLKGEFAPFFSPSIGGVNTKPL